MNARLDFQLPPELEAGEPPEARGLARDGVRLMVSFRGGDGIVHARFRDIGQFLEPGDVLVVNTSGTLNAALAAARADGTPLELHLSTQIQADGWAVELRRREGALTKTFYEASQGERLSLPEGGAATLHAPYRSDGLIASPVPARLWKATLALPAPPHEYLNRHGFPIRYSYVKQAWPIAYYQTVYATEPGSAEMPSAGRAFTPELITRLVAQGVHVAPLVLHTGVASLESHEPPYDEFYRVPAETERTVNAARAAGKRIVAVGTTVVRALETVAEADGVVHPGEGWTSLVITPGRGLRAVNALLTGFHDPEATHLAMLEALAGAEHISHAYREALQHGYLWHEFGDLHLILPG
jgi:S-adenosylmethionine:tRNA ribosyltransferase-isomerase